MNKPTATFFLVNLLTIGLTAALAVGEPYYTREIPDDNLTPGIVATNDVREICGTVDGLSYSKRHRHTSQELKRSIRERDHCDPHNSEVDHRCELALGCADIEQNLWCQPGAASGVMWNYKDKDKLELELWKSVCKVHTRTPMQAQFMLIAPADWRRSYCTVFADDKRCQK